MKLKTPEIFSTDSFILASYLLTESCHLISLDKTNIKRVVFNFENTKELEGLNQKFVTYEALIEPHHFASYQKDLKQLIFQNKNQYGRQVSPNTK